MSGRRRRFRVRHDEALASVGERITAKIIDAALLWVGAVAVFFVAGLLRVPDDDRALFGVLAGLLVLSVVYDVVFTAV